MRTFVKAFLAAVIGIALFIAGLIVWLEITGAGYGIFASATEDSASGISSTVTDNRTATGTGTGAGGSYGAAGTGTSSGAGTSYTADITLLPAPQDYGTGSGTAPGGNGTGTGTAAGGNGAGTGTGTQTGSGSGTAAGGSIIAGGNGSVLSTEEKASRLRDLRDQTERELRAINGDSLTVSVDGDTLTIAYWDNNLVDRLSGGANVAAIMNMWEQKKEQAQSLSSSYYKRLDAYDLKDAHVTVNLLSERDHEQIILSYEDGELRHDGLPESHLRSQRTDPDTTN